MWREERQSHVVVFDPVSRKLVGMAILYVEHFTVIDEHRPTLVMRAINTVDRSDILYSPKSVVDAFLKVGEEIALDNDMAALAFPSDDGGQHFLSNRSGIHSHITAICARAPRLQSRGWAEDARPSHLSQPVPYCVGLVRAETFYGYQEGNGPVNTLCVMRVPSPQSTPHADEVVLEGVA